MPESCEVFMLFCSLCVWERVYQYADIYILQTIFDGFHIISFAVYRIVSHPMNVKHTINSNHSLAHTTHRTRTHLCKHCPWFILSIINKETHHRWKKKHQQIANCKQIHTHSNTFAADQTFLIHCINDCDTYMIDSKSSKIRKFQQKNAKQYDFHLVQCLSRLLLLLCTRAYVFSFSSCVMNEVCIHVYVYLFLFFFVFWKKSLEDEDDGDISHGLHSQRSHTFIPVNTKWWFN